METDFVLCLLTCMTTGATAVTRPPAAGRRRRPPPGAGARVNGRRLETTIREDEVSDMLPLRLSETIDSISNKISFQTHDASETLVKCTIFNPMFQLTILWDFSEPKYIYLDTL